MVVVEAGAPEIVSMPTTRHTFQPVRVDTCQATPIPKDAGFWDEDGGVLANAHFEVPYGADVKQTFDIASPPSFREAGASNLPLVAIIHGGGWTAGDKHMFWPTLRALNDHGFVAATINYRLARDDARAFPVGVRDTRCALAYLVKHASDYGADPHRLALIGASAGGHIAALLGVAPDDPEWSTGCEDVRLEIAGVIAYYAPLGLETETGYPNRMHRAVWEFLRADAGTPEWQARARRATPANAIDETDPPFLLLHGTADTVVPADDSRTFHQRLDAHHVPNLFIELDGQEHGFAVLSRKPELASATCSAWDFLDRAFAR